MIVLTDGVSQLWKTVRKFIFEHLLEFKILPRESASAFKIRMLQNNNKASEAINKKKY